MLTNQNFFPFVNFVVKTKKKVSKVIFGMKFKLFKDWRKELIRIRILVVEAFIFMILLGAPSGSASEKADTVLKNGKVYTVDENMSQAEAVAIVNGKILAVGSNADVEKFVGDKTEVIDLDGKTVVPGLSDSHYHFIGVGKREFHLNLDGTKSMQEFLQKVKTEVGKTRPGEWVVGRGWMEEDWPSKRFPTRHDLDRVTLENPVLLRRADGHAIVVNSLALEIAGITKNTEDPQGGRILRDASGQANGLLLDKAANLVRAHIPADTTSRMLRSYARKADEVALAYGLTQVHDMGTDFKTLDLLKQMYKDDKLRIRLYTYIRGPGDGAERLLQEGAQIGLFDHKLTVRGIKISQDGALGSRGAALLEPYGDARTKGLLIYKDDQIFPIITTALRKGIQMAIHAIGDRANRNVLDLYERAFNEVPEPERMVGAPRFRIEHAQIVHPDDIPRFKQLGVIPSMQPSHAIGDLHFAVRRLGPERMLEGYAWRKFIEQGNYVPAGSDAPVEEGNPMIEFYAAVVRKDTTGFSAEGWHREYRMTRAEALQALTIWGARAAFMEDVLGSIEPGKYADLVVLDRDLMTEPEERLFAIKVLLTMVAGEVVYRREGFPYE